MSPGPLTEITITFSPFGMHIMNLEGICSESNSSPEMVSSPPWTLLLITVLQPKLLCPYLHRFASKFIVFLRTLST